MAGQRNLGLGPRAQTAQGQDKVAILDARWLQSKKTAGAFKYPQAAFCLKGLQHGCTFGTGKPVGNPVTVKRLLG